MIRLEGPEITPLEAARRLAGRRGRFLLHSGSDADGVGRWSFAGAEPAQVVSAAEVVSAAQVVSAAEDPFAAAAALVGEAQADGDPVPIAVGYFGYETVTATWYEPPHPHVAEGVPLFWFARHEAVWRHDARTGRAAVIAQTAEAAARLHALLSRPAAPSAPPRLGPLAADVPADRHAAAIARALAYIRAGDIYQVNLSRRLSAPLLTPGDPLALYERIAHVAPAPYGALLEIGGDTAILSNSPELFLRRRHPGGRLETRPIKGTRARGRTTAADAALAAALPADEKERAEHLMIVDLERNDLGRVARIGSVTVDDFCRVVSLPTVHHLISTVSCHPVASASVADVLRATFPGGSITGAPKVRAMQIIAELEPCPRGPYTGALGWLGPGGTLDLSIVIRTAVLTPAGLSLHVGGGIVADSTPARELDETEEKAAAWRAALG